MEHETHVTLYPAGDISVNAYDGETSRGGKFETFPIVQYGMVVVSGTSA